MYVGTYYARISLQNILKSGFVLLIYDLSNVGCDVITILTAVA